MKFRTHKNQIKKPNGKFSIPNIDLKKKKGIPLKFKLLIGFFTIFFLSGSMFIVGFYACQWYYSHTIILQSPIVMREPIIITLKKTPIFNPVSKINDPIINKAHAQVIEQIPSWKQLPLNVDKQKWEYIMSQPDARLVAYIWKSESDYGRDTVTGSLDQYCRTKGGYNETGWGGMADMTCFDTFAENIQATIKSLNGYGELTDLQRLCHYNEGDNASNCPYVKNY